MLSTVGWNVISDEQSLARLEGIWRNLGEKADASTPFQAFSWCRQWLMHRAGGATPYVLISEDKTLLAPFVKTTTAGIRVLRFMGTGDSDYLGLLSAIDASQAWVRIVNELAQRKKEWDVLHMHSIPNADDVLQALNSIKAMEAITRQYESCPYIAIRGGWAEYLASRKKAKYESKRWARRLSELGELTTEIIPMPVSSSLLAEMVAVEQSSWKWELGTAALKPGPQADFIRGVLQDPLMPAKVWLLRINGALVAFAVVLEGKGGWYYYLPSYRKDCPNSGAHLLAAIIAEAFRVGCPCIDLLQGDHGYKALWTDDTTDVSEIVVGHSIKGKAALRGYQLRWLASTSPAIRRLRAWMCRVGDRRQGTHSE